MKKVLTLLILSVLMAVSASAQRKTDPLDRGVVAVPSITGTGYLVSWRVLGEEYYDVTYNLYRNGVKIASNLEVSNYDDNSGTGTSSYQVSAVVKGVEQTLSTAISPWDDGYKSIAMATPTDRNGNDASAYYSLNDVSLGDLNGDGVTEFIVKRPCSDAADITQNARFNILDCYDINGNRLWWIDLGPNMISGPDEQWDCIAYDWDQDGKAEVILRCGDDAIIHFADGSSKVIGQTGVDTRYSGMSYTATGSEYLLYLEGATGKPYQIMDYPILRVSDGSWGYGVNGHRSSKHYFGAPYLDGRNASIFIARGCYSQHKMVAFDVDPATHAFTQRWYWECTDSSSPWFGQGYHNYAIGDVDWDGRDEIIFGSMVIDDNGKGLHTTGLGHGDSQHCADFDPYRKYEEQFACNEDNPAMNYRNATTGEIYYRITADGDDGRALMGNFTNAYPGSVGRTVSTGMVSSCSDKEISALGRDEFISWADLNSRIYWDGDLLDEFMDSPGTNGYCVVYKAGTQARLLSAFGTSLTNSSKNNFCAQGDIFGDWREELVLRADDNNSLRIYTTPYSTTYRIPTLWSDHQYRNAMAWQSMGYNQTPHKSYFLGELEGIIQAPPTNTMTGKIEVTNGETITTTSNHLIVCETNNTSIRIPSAGASPYIIEFNVPSHVEGTAESNTTDKNPAINYTYYTCNVTGGALTGSTRLVKTGEGVLCLPSLIMTYTGNTDIWGGTVNFSGTMQNSQVWMNRHTTLNTSEGTFKSIIMEYGSTLDMDGSATVGTLEMHEGARIKVDKDANEQIAITNLVLRNQKWQYGPEYLAPVIEVSSSAKLAKGAKFQIGTVSGTVTGDLEKVIVVSNIEMGLQGNLSLEDGKLYVTIDYDQSLCKRVGVQQTIWERGYTTSWTSSDAKSTAGSSIDSNYGLVQTGGNGSNATTFSISPSKDATIAVEAYWMGMSNTGRTYAQGNCSYFKFGNIWLMENDQDRAVAYSLDGGATYTTFTKNSSWADRSYDMSNKTWMVVKMEIDTKNNILNYLNVYSSDNLENALLTLEDVELATYNYSTFGIGYKKSGSVSTTNTEYLGKIKITEASYQMVYAGAKYAVKYVDETGATVKPSETRMGIYGNTIELIESDKEDIYSFDENNKWEYASNNAGILASDGSTVVTVTFNKKYRYTVNAVNAADQTNVLKSIATGYIDDAETLTVYYNHAISCEDVYYTIGAKSSSPYYGVTVSKNARTKNLAYTKNAEIYYYVEGEDAILSRSYGILSNNGECSGGGASGPYTGAHTYTDPVEAGNYTLVVKGIWRSSRNQTYTIRISKDNETFTDMGTITFPNAATGEKTLSITIPEDGYFVDILNSVNNNAYNYIDYFYLTRKTATYTVKFVDTAGNVIKNQESRIGFADATLTPSPTDMETFVSSDGNYKYVFSSYSLANGKTILSNGSQVLTVKYRKAIVTEKASLTLSPTSVDTYELGTYGTVTLNRNFKAGYSTLCVPFNTTVSELTGDDEAYAAYFSFVEDENGICTLGFTNTKNIEANQPYIIYLSKALEAPSFKDKPVFAENAKTITAGGWSMVGNYAVGKDMEGLYGVANNASIMKGGSGSTLNGFTAYLTGSASSARIRFSNGEETVITAVDSQEPTITAIYTVGGTRVATLQKGINLVRMSDNTVRKVFVK